MNTPRTSYFGNETAQSLVAVLRRHAEHSPGKRAVTFLDDAGAENDTASYSELDRRARGIAALLQERVEPGDRMLLIFAPSLDYVAAFFGCLYAGVIAVPTYPPGLNRAVPAASVFAHDCGASLVLTQPEILEHAEQLYAIDPELREIPW